MRVWLSGGRACWSREIVKKMRMNVQTTNTKSQIHPQPSRQVLASTALLENIPLRRLQSRRMRRIPSQIPDTQGGNRKTYLQSASSDWSLQRRHRDRIEVKGNSVVQKDPSHRLDRHYEGCYRCASRSLVISEGRLQMRATIELYQRQNKACSQLEHNRNPA